MVVAGVTATACTDGTTSGAAAPAASGGDVDGPAVSTVQAYLAGGTPEKPGFEVIAERPEITIEALVAARPDVIVSQSGWLEGIDDEIERLGAPGGRRRLVRRRGRA
jgi:ABC-type Fe3+-hydroxamate transport system substrate-binding protein